MANLLMEIVPMIGSMLVGVLVELTKQKMAFENHRTEMLIRQISAKEETIENARKYESPHSSKSRKVIVHCVMGSLFIFPMLLTIMNWVGSFFEVASVCISVPMQLEKGGLLSFIWNNSGEVDYKSICGFVLMPIHILMAQIIAGFYFGQAGTKLSLR